MNGVHLVRLRVCVLYKGGEEIYILLQMNLVAVLLDRKGSPSGGENTWPARYVSFANNAIGYDRSYGHLYHDGGNSTVDRYSADTKQRLSAPPEVEETHTQRCIMSTDPKCVSYITWECIQSGQHQI